MMDWKGLKGNARDLIKDLREGIEKNHTSIKTSSVRGEIRKELLE
jgi:hypothetical protein